MNESHASISVETPIGTFECIATDDAVVALRPWRNGFSAPERRAPILVRAKQELEGYFAGERRAFSVPVAPRGTEFQRAVWTELQRIPAGATQSYGEIAMRLGLPNAARAVGRANATNPIAIIVPCHRVIGANGSLTGYAWGTDKKAWLLEHERKSVASVAVPKSPS